MLKKHSSRLTRRNFLKTAGATLGMAVVTPVLPSGLTRSANQSVWSPQHSNAPWQVGLLLPTSTLYPTLRDDFLTGLKIALGQTNDQVEAGSINIIASTVNPGQRAMQQGLQSLIRENQLDLVVALIDPPLTTDVRQLLHTDRMPLVAAHIGANIPRADDNDPYVFHHSLNYWQANRAMGRWAAEHLGQRALVAMSFYESGYDAPFAFRLGFEEAGGLIVDTHVSHVPPQINNFETLFAKMEAARPDFVYGLYSGGPAVEFVTGWADRGLPRSLPLLGSSFMVDETLLPEHGHAAAGIKSILPWSQTLTTPDNLTFGRLFRATHHREPGALAFLGYDTARRLTSTLKAIEGNPRSPDNLMNALTAVPAARPLYLREVSSNGIQLHNQIITRLETTAAMAVDVPAMAEYPKTGWLNAYLAA